MVSDIITAVLVTLVVGLIVIYTAGLIRLLFKNRRGDME